MILLNAIAYPPVKDAPGATPIKKNNLITRIKIWPACGAHAFTFDGQAEFYGKQFIHGYILLQSFL
jgi:hypothetical protein